MSEGVGEAVGRSAAGAASYKEWVIQEAAKINTDGCTKALDWNLWCCYEHDLACHYGKDPEDAFHVGWLEAPYLRRKEADRRFWRCNRNAAPNPLGALRADIRYIGVRIGALWPF